MVRLSCVMAGLTRPSHLLANKMDARVKPANDRGRAAALEARMKVHVIGGGPAGLYFSILLKKAWPQTRISVFERNKPDDTFGFGVVFSDQTLEAFESYDRETYRQIVGHFAYWDDIEIHFRGTTHRIGGNGFCGTSRTMLLKILGRRARSLGVEIRYQSEISPLDPITHDADLVVVADGINSRMRETFADK